MTAELEALLARVPVVPVLTVTDPEHAIPLARALVTGGLPVLEITLRTDVALDVIRSIAHSVPGAVVGAGTVTRPEQFELAAAAGARFAVSPGCTAALLQAARHTGMPFLPGAATVSDAMGLRDAGFRLQKFFPAGSAGGPAFLRAIHAPLPELRFCPTGGVTSDNAMEYLSCPNVVCVGGSWIAPADAVAAQDWDRIESLARAAGGLLRPL